jgi:hypothetical protein
MLIFLTNRSTLAIKVASIYIYAGSASVMLVYGTASAVLNTGVFYTPLTREPENLRD